MKSALEDTLGTMNDTFPGLLYKFCKVNDVFQKELVIHNVHQCSVECGMHFLASAISFFAVDQSRACCIHTCGNACCMATHVC